MSTLTQFDVAGRTAVVIGAASGIGRAVAQGLADAGAKTVWVDRDEQALEEITRSLTDAVVRVTNILDRSSVEELANEYADAEILVVTPAILVRKTIADHTEEEFDRQVALNLKATFFVAQAFSRVMADHGRGSIIAFSSIRATLVEPGSAIYAMTKAGVAQLMRTLAAEVGPRGVRVNLIAPSPVETPLTADVRGRGDWYDAVREHSMLRRWGQPEDFVGPVLLLASDAGSFITGAQLAVDGGWTAVDGMARVPEASS